MIRTAFLAFSLFATLLFSGCDGDVRFTTDQPQGLPVLADVPATLRGTWVSGSDTLNISPRVLQLVRASRRTVPLSDTARMGVRRTGTGKLEFKAGEARTVERVSGDSMVVLSRMVNSYQLGRDTVLKNWNGSWWLSTRADAGTWKVMQISVRKKQLIIAVPNLPREEKRAMDQRLAASVGGVDSVGSFSRIAAFRRPKAADNYYVVAASPVQLKALQAKGLFRPVATFTKIK